MAGKKQPSSETTFDMKEEHVIYTLSFEVGNNLDNHTSTITGYEIYIGNNPDDLELVAHNDNAAFIGNKSRYEIELNPKNGRYLKVKITSIEDPDNSKNIYIRYPRIIGHLSHEEGIINDSDSNATGGLSWLSSKMAEDDQFAKGAVYFGIVLYSKESCF